MNTNGEYFFYGSAIEYPRKYMQYGLYSPVIDCFALVHSDKDTLNIISKLFSSRYHLILCRLDCAKNFKQNLVDNSVCFNWSIKNFDPVDVTMILSFDLDEIVKVDQLINVFNNNIENDLLYKDHNYLMAAVNWLNFLKKIKQGKTVEQKHIDYLEIDIVDESTNICIHKNLSKKIHNIIYNTFDFNQAQVAVDDVLKSYGF